MMTLKGKKVGEKHSRNDSPKQSNTVVRTQAFKPDGCKWKLQLCLLLADVMQVFLFS